jgi:hypothetical protein
VLARRLWKADGRRNREVGQGGQVRRHKGGLTRQSRIFHNVSFGKNVGSQHVATGTVGLNLGPRSGRSCAAGSPATDCLMSCWSEWTYSVRASTRSPLSIEMSAKIPLQHLLGRAKVPTGLDCGELFYGSHWGLLGQPAGGCEWGTVQPGWCLTRSHSASHRHFTTFNLWSEREHCFANAVLPFAFQSLEIVEWLTP